MELTKEYLESKFKCDNPDSVFPKYYLSGERPDWRIAIEAGYIPGSKEIGYSVSTWSCNSSRVIVKRCQAGFISTTEDLELITKLINIPIDL